LGALIFNIIHRKLDAVSPEEEAAIDEFLTRRTRNPTLRWKLMLSFLIQAFCIALAAALAQGHVVSNQKISDAFSSSSGNKKMPTEWVPHGPMAGFGSVTNRRNMVQKRSNLAHFAMNF